MGRLFSKIIGGGGVGKVVDSIASGIDGLITSDEERLELRNELEELLVRDRQSARDMYKDDSSLQKWFALVFLISYMLLTVAMLYFIYLLAFGMAGADVNLPNWAVAFLSTLFGAMSAKVSTITDFLFGGSKSNEDFVKRKK